MQSRAFVIFKGDRSGLELIASLAPEGKADSQDAYPATCRQQPRTQYGKRAVRRRLTVIRAYVILAHMIYMRACVRVKCSIAL